MFVLSLGGFIYFIFFIYYITFLAAVLYIDVHGWKSRRGSSDFAKNLEGVNAFRTKSTGGPLFLVLLHFYLQVFLQIC